MKELRIGVSGWSCADWRGRFYPAGLPRGRDTFVYFDNDYAAHAPHDALRPKRMLRV